MLRSIKYNESTPSKSIVVDFFRHHHMPDLQLLSQLDCSSCESSLVAFFQEIKCELVLFNVLFGRRNLEQVECHVIIKQQQINGAFCRLTSSLVPIIILCAS